MSYFEEYYALRIRNVGRIKQVVELKKQVQEAKDHNKSLLNRLIEANNELQKSVKMQDYHNDEREHLCQQVYNQLDTIEHKEIKIEELTKEVKRYKLLYRVATQATAIAVEMYDVLKKQQGNVDGSK